MINLSAQTLRRSCVFGTGSLLARFALALMLLVAHPVSAADADAFWLDDSLSDSSTGWRELLALEPGQLIARADRLPRTGGTFWHLMSAQVLADKPLVIDFKNSSVVGLFSHFVIDAHGEAVAAYHGGIQSTEVNGYFLRHGRALSVPPGQYRIFTRMSTPFSMGQPTPALYDQASYQESIKLSNGLTLMALGMFLALGLYYLILGLVRHHLADFFYSMFIFGNLIYNATALNVFSDIFAWPIIYSISLTVMASNLAYMGFVMCLLGIAPHRTPWLYKAGLLSIATIASFWLLLPLLPQYSYQFAGLGAVIFALYGLTAGIALTRRGHKTARYYLIANIAFIIVAFGIPLFLSLTTQFQTNSILFVEHLGLIAVAIEVVLLSLVLGHQLNIIYLEKSASLLAAREAIFAADQAVRSKERFLANISHELRTPLTAIRGSVELLNEQVDKPKKLAHLAVIDHASSFLLFLINDILDLAKLKDNKLTIDNQPFNIQSLAEQIARIYAAGFGNNPAARFELIIAPELPKWIIGDEQRIEQVIANLLSNAFKFAPQGTVTLELSVDIRSQLVKISVIDNGIGMDPKSVQDMFRPFSQADSSTSRLYGGTGLGLTIARDLVELMAGQIGAESQLGLGSQVWFTLPLIVAPAPAGPLEGAVQPSQPDFEGRRIVVVDDNEVNLKVVCGLLKRLNIEIKPFSRAQAALDYVGQHPIDLVIMDIQMPEMDGLTATKTLRERGFTQPIIAFTANSSEQDRQDCLVAGTDDILVKPIKRQALVDMLLKWPVTR